MAIFVVSLALIRDGHTDILSVEGPSLGALEANLVIPIPSGTSEVSGVGGIFRGVNTLTIDIVVTSKAGEAVSGSLVEGVALGAHGSADAVSIEPAPVSALDAGLVTPGLAERVRFGHNAGVVVDHACTFLNQVSIVAAFASAGLVVPGGAEITDGDADTVGIEVPSP